MSAHSGTRFELIDEADFFIDPQSTKYPYYRDIIADSNMFMTSGTSVDTTTGLQAAFDNDLKLYKTGFIDQTKQFKVTHLSSVAHDMNGSSFMLWFKTGDTNYSTAGNYTGRATLLSLGYFSDYFGPALWLQNGPPYRIFAESSTNNENWINVSSAVQANSWNNLTCVFTNGNTATSYLNGVEIDEVTGLSGAAVYQNLGGGAISPGTWGSDLRYSIYARWDSKALSYSEVQDLHIAFRSRHGIV